MASERKKVVLGPEWDQVLRARLFEVLKRMGAIAAERGWGVGGSQEIESVEVSLGEDVLLVEAETYIGLMITGPKDVVDQINDLLAAHPR
jgi:hypothetical protein